MFQLIYYDVLLETKTIHLYFIEANFPVDEKWSRIYNKKVLTVNNWTRIFNCSREKQTAW